jgi:hypothetical protein
MLNTIVGAGPERGQGMFSKPTFYAEEGPVDTQV